VGVLERIDEHIRRYDLIEPGGAVLCLVSGGPDSTCLFHAMRELGYRVSALHVNYCLRGTESEEDARFCAVELGADVIRVDSRGASEAELRSIRYGQRSDRLRATGHTADDQVETVLYRLATSGSRKGVKPKREDGVIRPLLPLWRAETRAFCDERELRYRIDSSNPNTVRGLIRDGILPLLEQIHPAARQNILRALEERRTMPPALAELVDSTLGSKRVDLGDGVQAVREHDRLWLERSPVELQGEVRWGSWLIRSELPGLRVRGWRPGDRLAGRSKKVQDVFVDAKVPRSDREGWPLVVRGDEVVAVPGILEAPGVVAVRDA
jgi:tRNA(Ile)-lysidine synthase